MRTSTIEYQDMNNIHISRIPKIERQIEKVEVLLVNADLPVGEGERDEVQTTERESRQSEGGRERDEEEEEGLENEDKSLVLPLWLIRRPLPRWIKCAGIATGTALHSSAAAWAGGQEGRQGGAEEGTTVDYCAHCAPCAL